MQNDLQRTDEWHLARLGKVTASRLYDVCKTLKNGDYSAVAKDYMMELALKRITGKVTEQFTSPAMQWGIDTEPLAKQAYEIETGNQVQDVGFIDHPTIEDFGASPDGLLLDMWGESLDAIIEIKCPTSKTHLSYIADDQIPLRYQYQMAAQMMVTGFKEGVFVSYDPRFPINLQLFIKDFKLTDSMEAEIIDKVNRFNIEVNKIVERLEELSNE